ncbi:titin-like%2C partial [Scomber scombrus]|uniref:Titin-like, partial n=1 Tax=Scomber scombrus TaxID=13677 RepID=A0AAV1Q752_SCOSC|nr:myelin-oligodendrocyte glycoprotein-like [Scomber scombrus]
MSASKSTLSVFLLICFLSCSVSEDPQEQPITVQRGDDVVLPCEAPNNVNIAVVTWTRSNPEKHVYMKIDGHLETEDQDPSYVNRVQLMDDEMKNGELSLILENVNNNDVGTYYCYYKEGTGRSAKKKFSSIVYLIVEDGRILLELILAATLIPAALVVAGIVGFVIYKKRKGRSENNPDLPDDDPEVLQQL